MPADATDHKIQLFQGQRVRTVWEADEEKWYFSVVDVVAVLTDSADPKQYIKKMRRRDPELNGSWGTICTLTRMLAADGKQYKTQAATIEGIFRIIQSIPSKKAEPFKQWMARVAQEGAEVARGTRDDIEARIGHTIISSERAIDHTNPAGMLPLNDPEPFAE